MRDEIFAGYVWVRGSGGFWRVQDGWFDIGPARGLSVMYDIFSTQIFRGYQCAGFDRVRSFVRICVKVLKVAAYGCGIDIRHINSVA